MSLFGYVPNSTTSQKRDKLFTGAQRVLNNKLNEDSIQQMEHEVQRENQMKQFIENSSLSRKGSNHALFQLKNKYTEELKHQLFVESMFGIVMEALVIDDQFKQQFADNIYNLTENTIQNFFDAKGINVNKLKNESSEFIKELVYLCEDTAKKQADEEFAAVDPSKVTRKDILNEKGKDKKKAKVVSPEIKGEFDDAKSLDSRNVSELVKDKVIKVVRDEQELAEKEQGINDQIKEKTAKNEDLLKSGKKSLEQIKSEAVKVIPKNKLQEHSLFKSLQLNIARNNLAEMKETLSEAESLELNMDMVFVESLTYYTLLECLYTTKVIDLSAQEARKFAKELTFAK